jgi:hypothetical protein
MQKIITQLYYLPQAVSEKETPGYYVVRRNTSAATEDHVVGPFRTLAGARKYINTRDGKNASKARTSTKRKQGT